VPAFDVGSNGHRGVVSGTKVMPKAGFLRFLRDEQGSKTGTGLVVIGGFDSYDRGGYQGTQLESILPVKVGKPKRELGDNSLIFVIQVSGSTIFVSPLEILPLRNAPVITPDLPLEDEALDVAAIAQGVRTALRRLDLHEGEQPVALCYRWGGSATFRRLDDFCRGVAQGMSVHLAKGHPLILVGDGDIGGLVGIHALEEAKLPNPIVSIDGIVLKEFDFIDIGALLETSGAVPVVIKSLVFPTSSALGKVEGARNA
jgi:hypothetical protein